MNVPTIKLLCWLTSSALLAALLLYLAGFVRNREAKQRPVNVDYVRAVLQEDLAVAPDVKQGLEYARHVQPTFLGMNWTGRKPVEVVKPELNPGPKSTSRYKPIDQILRVLLIMTDTDDPGGSRAHVTFLGGGDQTQIFVGDVLPKPHEYWVVAAIRGDEVEFACAEEGHPNEVVGPRKVDIPDLIVDYRQELYGEIPKASEEGKQRPAQTTRLGGNVYQLGTEDMQNFADNYAAILTNEVRTRTYYDENNRRAGIEVQRVEPGGVAARHGAMDGDVIISINGTKVTSESEAIQYVKANQDKFKVWEVKILRLGREETIVYSDK